MSKDYAKVTNNEPRDRPSRGSGRSSGLLTILVLIVIAGVLYYAFSRGILVVKTDTIAQVAHQPAGEVVNNKTKPEEPAKPRFEFYTLLSKETVPVSRPGKEPGTHEQETSADVTTDTLPPPESAKSVATTPEEPLESSDAINNEIVTETPAGEPAVAPTGVPAVPVIPVSGSSARTANPPPAPATTPVAVPAVTAPAEPTTSGKHYLLQVAAFQSTSEADRLKAQLTFLGFDVIVTPFDNHGKQWYRVKVGPFDSLTAAQEARKTLLKNHLGSILVPL